MKDLRDKRLLVLGGANQHVKLVKAAKSLGVYTVVADYLEQSPAKLLSDESWLIDIFDIDKLAEKCRSERIDGVIAGFLDPCQIPYFRLCQQLNLPCFGTEQQFHCFTNKKAFKKMCSDYCVGTIQDLTLEDVLKSDVHYPVYVKPVDSRGSRGQAICRTGEQLLKAVDDAMLNSSNGDYIIERYMGECDEFQVTYFVINGKAYLERTADSYKGSIEYGLNKIVNCSISPSRLTDDYLKTAHYNVLRMIENMGINNGPVFMQGFHRDGEFYFFDPGLRFPGVEFELMVKQQTRVDFMTMMVNYALTGSCGYDEIKEDIYKLDGKYGAILFPVLREGQISAIDGVEQFLADKRIVSYNTRYSEGDRVDWTTDVNQRFAEVDIIGNTINDISECILKFQETVKVLDTECCNMLIDPFDTNLIKEIY